jgi:heme exporter protein A
MRKRLSLGRVLLQHKPVALLDEPYGELDPPGFELLDGVIAELRARGATVVMATHLVERGRRLCDRALLLDEGQLVWSGPAAEMPDDALRASAAP